MVVRLVFFAPFLLVSSSALADIFGDVTRNVPQPMSPPEHMSRPVGIIGDETLNANRLVEENVQLKKLLTLQNQKIQLLETRLKELESKK